MVSGVHTITGLGTVPVAFHRATRSGSQTTGFGRGLGVLIKLAGFAIPTMISLAKASLNALRNVARTRAMVACPVGRTPRTLARTAGSLLVRASRIAAFWASI